MNVITHSLLPITLKQTTELRRAAQPDYRTQVRGWIIIAVFGSLPDILNPHISLGARCDSFSHVWPFTTGVVVLCGVVFLLFQKRPWSNLALWGALAYVLHVAGDIVSGGLDFFATGHAIGDYWITPGLWPVFDGAFIVAFVVLHRRIRQRHGLIPSVVEELRTRHARRRAHAEGTGNTKR